MNPIFQRGHIALNDPSSPFPARPRKKVVDAMTTKKTPVDRLVAACASGDERLALESLRDELAAAVAVVPKYALPPLAARLQAVLERLSELSAREPRAGDVVAELAARRAARRAEALS